MRVVAVIPARGGSKRVPRKNLHEVGLKPLLAWSILTAKAAYLVDRVIVSTDDDEIAQTAELWGAEVHRRKSPSLSCDNARIEAVLRAVGESIDFAFDYMVTLEPTHGPLREGLVDDCIKRAAELYADSVFSAKALPQCWLFEVASGGEWMDSTTFRRVAPPLQFQQVGPQSMLYWADGRVAVSSAALVRKGIDRLGGRAFPYVERLFCTDVDEPGDLKDMEALITGHEMLSRKNADAA